MYDYLKNLILVTFTGLLSIVSSYQSAFISLFVGFVFNFIMGIMADAQEESESFSLKKAGEGLKLFMFYCITTLALYGMTYSEPTVASTIMKWTTYIVGYFYLVNIFRNAKRVFPTSKPIAFMYLLLSTEIFYLLKDMLKIRNKDAFDDFIDKNND